MTVNRKYYCSCPDVKDPTAEDAARLKGHRSAILTSAKWEVGADITIRFLGGASELQQRVRVVAQEWTGTGMANLNFVFMNEGPTNIRISFEQDNRSWSYIGTQCNQIKETAATMNYGWLTLDSSDDELRRVVLHEFGHAIGMIHEHQNPKDGGIKWNRSAVIKDLSGPPNNWDLATIETNMFKMYEANGTPVDNKSIMMYPIPLAWTLDGTSAGLNSVLSPTDKQFVRDTYFF